MRLLIAALAIAIAAPALAQQSPAEGNWVCRANIDGTKAGLLTIFAGTYGYASRNFDSKASGTGRVELATDGATFLDGSLVVGAGITFSLASLNPENNDILTLYQPQPDGTAAKPILTCSVRR
jgi:hypothetical protein